MLLNPFVRNVSSLRDFPGCIQSRFDFYLNLFEECVPYILDLIVYFITYSALKLIFSAYLRTVRHLKTGLLNFKVLRTVTLYPIYCLC